MYVVDMETRLPIESLPRPPSGYGWSRQVYCAEGTGKVYWIYQNGEYLHETDSVFVFDPQLDSITAVFNLPFMSTEVCEDRTGDYVYFASGGRISVVDTRCDSVVSSVGTLVGAQSLVRNQWKGMLSAAQSF